MLSHRSDDEFKFLHSYILIILFKNSAYSDAQQLLFKNTSNWLLLERELKPYKLQVTVNIEVVIQSWS